MRNKIANAIAIILTGGGLVLASTISIADSTPQLHPVEAACVEYELTGQMMNGTSTRCHRDYAYEAYEIQNMEVGFGGFNQTQNQHNITIGDTIYAIDLQTNTGTKTTNPMYAGIVDAMQNSSAEELSATYMSNMGFTPNGQSKTIADTECNVYSSMQLGTVCMTDDGLMLEQDFMGNKQIAVSVSIGDGGDDENYTLYQNVPITEGPDLSNGLEGLEGLEGLMEQLGQQPQR